MELDFLKLATDLKFDSIHFHTKPEIGLIAIIGLHNLKFGPAIGGCRFIEYESNNDAIVDAIRLARGMTYKAAISNLNHGGGKSVIIKPKNLTEEQRVAIFTEFGKFVDSLGGKYITAEDSGTSVEDMNLIKAQTDHVLGYDSNDGGSGDPSPLTALGVRRGIEAAVKHRLGKDDFAGLHFAVQGLGHVGYDLAKQLHERGAKLTVTDVNKDNVDRCVKELGATAVAPDEIFAVDCDVLVPCALGGIINDTTLPQLKCKVVAGAANNQLLEPKHGQALHDKKILYAPDYAINAGGLINVASEYTGYEPEKVMVLINAIYDTMLSIFERSDKENLPPAVIADKVVEEKLYH